MDWSYSLVLPHRFIDGFNNIYKFITTGFLCWALTSICVIILVISTQLVEYTRTRNECSSTLFFRTPTKKACRNFSLFVHQIIISEKFKSSGIGISIDDCVRIVFRAIILLRMRRTGHQPICPIRWSALQMWLVQTTNGTAKNDADFHDKYPTTADYSWLCKCCLHTRIPQKSKHSFFWCFKMVCAMTTKYVLASIWFTDNQRCFFILYDPTQNG